MGTLYKQVDPFTACKWGASLVAQNIARHLQTHFADKDRDYHPLIYCIGSPFLQGVGGDGEATPAQTLETNTD
ncbi:hypothetical protein [Synechococcus sp. H55.10]|uniref:hypothetical protein n=1 Tax=Synechococcus sp. H55.10 TaxID=2964503 RepID=UPI0039C74A34